MTFKFFLIPFYVPDNYSPEAIALGEGLAELGHKVISNINYWYIPEENRYLFNEDSESDYDVGIYDYKYLYHSKKWTLNRVNTQKLNVLLDRNDWLIPEWNNKQVIDKFNVILADHLLAHVQYPSNIHPWAIGYTNRIKKYIDESRNNFQSENKEIVYNFRVGHNLRGFLLDKIKKIKSQYSLELRITDNLFQTSIESNSIDSIYWKQTAKRHNPDYYKLLNRSLMTLAFGGYFEYKPFFYQPYTLFERVVRKPFAVAYRLLTKFNADASSLIFVFQYDSFRMWEAFYSNTCPILLDMKYWNFKLPVMPVEGEHYIGIRKMDCKTLDEKLNTLTPETIMKIGSNGSKWVQEYYSPVAVAQRLEKKLAHL
ncbi:MAG: hypothetical protein LBV47_03890 [Bacteroidales bacterium]|jgi:hypothetical protein|nr:hypothetical protein [Bacteroidales bacterium]